MGVEIERKFLLSSDAWRDEVVAQADMIQGYLALTNRCSVRVRISGEEATLNFKGLTIGIRRSEFEYSIPVADARAMIDEYCGEHLIDKRRHLVDHAGSRWEIDEFRGANAGLVVAELELDDPEERFARPSWLGREVTDELRYYNIALLERPYREWDDG
jgi:adenylate cyclase